MYEVSLCDGFREETYSFKTLEEAMRAFERSVESRAEELRNDIDRAPETAKEIPVATIKIQKIEDVVSVSF